MIILRALTQRLICSSSSLRHARVADMKFRSRQKSRSRRSKSISAPAVVDTLESRLLLTTPNLLTPAGTFTTPTPTFSWEAVDTATSYDLWVSSLETYETVFIESGITGTSFTPAEGMLPQGSIRVWVQANLSGGTVSGWSPAVDLNNQAAPLPNRCAAWAPPWIGSMNALPSMKHAQRRFKPPSSSATKRA